MLKSLSGLGGDELFLGYNAHKIMPLTNKAHHLIPDLISSTSGSLAAVLIATSQRTIWSEAERTLRMLQHLGHWPHVYGLLRNLWDRPTLRRRIYGLRMLDSQLPNAFTILEELWPHENDPVMAMAQFELKNKMVNDLLWQEDRVSMAEGLEVRVPSVDKSLIAHLQHFQRKQLMINNKPKGYMRTLLKEILPNEILTRPKSGFQINSPEFYHQHLKPLATIWLSEERIHNEGLFNPSFVKEVLSKPPRKSLRWHYFMLYLMLLSHMWIDIFEHKTL